MANRTDEISAAIDRLELLIEQMKKVGSDQVVELLQAAQIELLTALKEEEAQRGASKNRPATKRQRDRRVRQDRWKTTRA
jgi:hypothetical protein